MTEEINGRDGDLITDLGYGAYDKELVIGLYGNYDINEVIGFFNQEGTIVFSNEDDKYYNFKIINQIDYEALIKFRTATISLHCQPFKYPLTETPEEITTEYVEDEGETITLNDTKIAPLSITPKGNTSQITYSGKNLLNLNNVSGTSNNVAYSVNNNGELVLNGTCNSDRVEIPLGISVSLNGTYTYSKPVFTGSIAIKNSSYTNMFILGGGALSQTETINDSYTQIVIYTTNGTSYNNLAVPLQIESGSSKTNWEPYVGGSPSPNPDYPQEVNVVTGDNEVKIEGKNLLDLSLFNNTEYYSISDNNVTSLKNDNRGWSSLPYITLNAGTYTFVTDNTIKRVQVGDIDTIQAIATATSGNYLQFTLTATSKIGFKLFGLSGDTYPITYTKPMLLKGAYSTYPTSYTPYTSQNYPLYLGVENLFDNVLEAGSIDASGNNVSSTDRVRSTNYIKVEPNTTYYLSSDFGSLSVDNNVFGRCYDSSKTYASALSITKNGSFTIPSGVYYFRIQYIVGNNNQQTAIDNHNISITKGSTPQYISDNPIELNKIGTYQDYIYKTGDKWYLHKEVGKLVLNGSNGSTEMISVTQGNLFRTKNLLTNSLNMNTIAPLSNNYHGIVSNNFGTLRQNNDIYIVWQSTNEQWVDVIDNAQNSIQNWQTWLSNNNTNLYYVLATPTDTEITNTTLINQLESLKGATSYVGQTNISQVNNDLPFILGVKGAKEGSGEGIINNIGNIYAKPIIALEGTGNIGIYKNGTQYFEVDMSNDNEITIDTENMEAYHNGVLKNRKVIGDYNKFTIDEGNNNIEITGELTKATISNYTRWL